MATKPSIALVPFPVQMMSSPVAMGSNVPAWPICMDVKAPVQGLQHSYNHSLV